MHDKKILIVDYDRKNLDSMAGLFVPYKLQIVKAIDGEMAYEKYKQEKPDLIILEAMLPKLHGFDLTQKIYSESKGSLPIIIVTALYKGAQYRNEAMRTFGAAEYFEKPFDNDKLIKSVLNLLYEEIEISVDLPSTKDVLKMISEMAKEG